MNRLFVKSIRQLFSKAFAIHSRDGSSRYDHRFEMCNKGCVRATRVDGVSLGYWVIVPPECVGNWHEVPHEVNLFNIGTNTLM